MRIRLSVGATLLAVAALNATPASAQTPGPKGTICVENAGAFVIETEFTFIRDGVDTPLRVITTGYYPVLQTKCVEFTDEDKHVTVLVKVLAGVEKRCSIYLANRAGGPITMKMQGTTLINQLECRH